MYNNSSNWPIYKRFFLGFTGVANVDTSVLISIF